MGRCVRLQLTLYPPRFLTLQAKEASLPWLMVTLLMLPRNSGARPVAPGGRTNVL